MFSADRYLRAMQQTDLTESTGRLQAIHGLVLEAAGCNVHLGEMVEIRAARDATVVQAEVVGLAENRFLLMPFKNVTGLCLESRVRALGVGLRIPVGSKLLGRVVSALGEPLDELGEIEAERYVPSLSAPINPLHRLPIDTALTTGTRAVDAFIPLGRGQRLGIFAGSGVGKSTLLGMLARHTEADVVVIALIGERGREVGDFIRDSLGERGLARALVVVASAEEPAILRRQAAYTATCMAEHFRAKGQSVLLIMDSMTRFAMAQREIGLAISEPMGARGYPPSVFGLLPPLLERAGGLRGQGSITALYTVLVEGDDMNEPVSDHMRAVLDGHIMLSRDLAARGHYPAIDILHSVSRLTGNLQSREEQLRVQQLRALMATYANARDLIELGAYQAGGSQDIDRAIRMKPAIEAFLQQAPGDYTSAQETREGVQKLCAQLGGHKDA